MQFDLMTTLIYGAIAAGIIYFILNYINTKYFMKTTQRIYNQKEDTYQKRNQARTGIIKTGARKL